MTFEEIFLRLRSWAEERSIDTYSDKQVMKLSEEVGELNQAILKGNREQEQDSVGDILVVLNILCLQRDIDPVRCLEQAYRVIENRTGKTVNGTFIKTEDLEG